MTTTRSATSALLVLLALAGLTGCSTGPRRGYLAPQGDGATGRIGAIVVTDAELAFTGRIGDPVVLRAGASAPVHATVVNTGDLPDLLLSVRSPVAGGADMTGGAVTGGGVVPAHDELVVGGATVPAAAPGTSVGVVLTDLRVDVRSGLDYPADFTFARAGTLRLMLPVALPDQPRTGCPLPPEGRSPDVLTAPRGAPVPPTTAPPDCSSLGG